MPATNPAGSPLQIHILCWINAKPVIRALMALHTLDKIAFPATFPDIPPPCHMLQPHFTSPHSPNTVNIPYFSTFAFGYARIVLCPASLYIKNFSCTLQLKYHCSISLSKVTYLCLYPHSNMLISERDHYILL